MLIVSKERWSRASYGSKQSVASYPSRSRVSPRLGTGLSERDRYVKTTTNEITSCAQKTPATEARGLWQARVILDESLLFLFQLGQKLFRVFLQCRLTALAAEHHVDAVDGHFVWDAHRSQLVIFAINQTNATL